MMNSTTDNGKTHTQSRAANRALPNRADNPFLRPAWPKTIGPDSILPPRPGPGASRELQRVYQKGEVQFLKQAIQRGKGLYAVGASSQVDDFANHCFTHVGTNIVVRKRANPYEELDGYLDVMFDAQMLRMGQEFNQIASDHSRSQNGLLTEPIEIDEEGPRSLMVKLAQTLSKGV